MKQSHLSLSLAALASILVLAACGGAGTEPATPQNFVAEATSSTTVALSWDAVGGASYALERKSGGAAYVGVATTADTSYSDEGLTPNTEYSYRLRAVSGGSSSSGVEAVATTLAEAQPGTQSTILEGLNGPLGLLVAPDGALYAVDSGTGGDNVVATLPGENGEETPVTFGNTSRVIRVTPGGAPEDVALLPSLSLGGFTVGGNRLVLLGESLYVTLGDWDPTSFPFERPSDDFGSLVRIANGETVEVADTWEYEEANNPDGLDPGVPGQDAVHSHPYDMTVGSDGNLYVTDAGGNDLLKIDPESGDITVVAVFEQIPLDSEEGPVELQYVPTGVAFGEDGTLYVSSFYQGVVQVTSEGAVTPFATNIGGLTDLEAAPDGALYAVSFGDESAEGPSGQIIRVGEGETSEVVLKDLPFPSAIAFNAEGDAYITLNTVIPGQGQVIKVEALTELEAVAE